MDGRPGGGVLLGGKTGDSPRLLLALWGLALAAGLLSVAASVLVALEVALPAPLLPALATGALAAAGTAGWQSRRRLAETQGRFLQFVGASTQWFWETDAELRLSHVLGGLRTVSGADVAQVIGRTRADLVAMDLIDPAALKRHVEDIEARRPFQNFVYPVRLPDGKVGYVRSSGQPVFSPGGRFQGYRGIASDVTADREAAANLKAAEADHRALFENLPIGLYRSSPDGRQLRANPALVALNGYASEAEQIAAVNDIATEWYVDPDRRSQFVAAMERHGRVQDFESEIYRHKTRERIWISETAVPIRDRAGRILYYEGSVQDISARKRAEEALLASEARLREAQELAHLGYWELDHATGQVWWSESICRIYEIQPGSFSGLRDEFLTFVHPDDREGLMPPDRLYREGADTFVDEYRLVMRDGRIKYVQSRGSAVRGPDGRVIRTNGTMQDISEARMASTELQQRTDQLRLTFDNMDQGVQIIGADGRITSWNQRLFELLDLPPGTLTVGMPYREYGRYLIRRGEFGEVDEEAELDRLGALPHAGETVIYERARPNGTALEVRIRALPEGSMIITYTDVSVRRRIEHELREAKEQAEAANEAKSSFLANMSHELRTPLNAILGFAEVIRDRILGPDEGDRYSSYANHIHESGTHLLALINDILDMSKIDAGRLELADEELELSRLARDSIEMVRGTAQSSGLAISFDDAVPVVVIADRRALKQVLLNLLSNSVKFTEAGGSVTVSSRMTAAGGVALAVADTGIGITSDALPRIFEPFHQGENTLSRRFGGTGLGLSISRRLMELHGGTLEITSSPGIGTLAVVALPAARLVLHSGAPQATLKS